MKFGDTFKGQQYKSELDALQLKYDDLEKMLTPEMRDTIQIQDYIKEINAKKNRM